MSRTPYSGLSKQNNAPSFLLSGKKTAFQAFAFMNNNASASHQEPTWGFADPECRGAAALLFFTSDLTRVVKQYLGNGQLSDMALADAQKAVDALVQRYIEIEAAPAAFSGQRITLALETEQQADGQQNTYVALQMSPHLEALIIEAQQQAHLDATLPRH